MAAEGLDRLSADERSSATPGMCTLILGTCRIRNWSGLVVKKVFLEDLKIHIYCNFFTHIKILFHIVAVLPRHACRNVERPFVCLRRKSSPPSLSAVQNVFCLSVNPQTLTVQKFLEMEKQVI